MRRKLRGAALSTVAIGAVSMGLATPVSADPKKGEVLEIECEELGTLEVVTFGNGLWTPGLATGSTQVGIPYAFRFEFTPTGGDTEVEEIAKPAPRHGRLDVCTFGGEEPEGTFVGTVWISYTPSKS